MEMLVGEGDEGLSIHPGPGELVHQGPHPLEVQSHPENQGKFFYN